MTASGAYVVRAQGDKKSRLQGYDTLKWPTAPGHTKSVVSDLAWNLAPLQDVAPAVADLVHIAAGAYMADRSTRRGARFSRDIALHVTVVAPELWTEELLDTTSELLGWLTGDTWNLTVAGGAEVDFEETLKVGDNGSVALLFNDLNLYPCPFFA